MTTRNRELAGIIDASGNITAGGNLTVSGTTTTVSSTVETHADPLIELNTGAGSNSNDLGFVFERGSTGDNACLIWDESNDVFAVGTTTATGTSTGNMSFTAAGLTAAVGTFSSLDISGNADIDGTLEADVITVDGTALNEYIADTVGAMVSSNTETNIAVTYEDGDNTLDFVIGTLNQDTTGTAATVTTAAQPNITSLGTLTTLTVDDITINGSTISDAGDMTLDIGGDIILDADGADFIFKDAGSEKLRITLDGDHTIIDAEDEIRLDSKFGYFRLRENGTNVGMFDISNAQDFVIRNLVADEDIIFKGTDGSSLITALTLDMSEAGAATFNNLVDATNYKINGAQGSDGQLMTSTGSGVAWEDAAEGGISTGKAIAMAMVFG